MGMVLSRLVSVSPSMRRGRFGVSLKQLVEIAHAKEQEHAGMAFLGLPVLLHHRWSRVHS